MANSTKGKVLRLYVQKDETLIRLGDTNAVLPKDGYFRLHMTANANYNALYSLALAAAVNGYPLRIDAVQPVTPEATAEVDYMVLDF
jgi:hypothetical protein